jgi:uncharacterized protein (DUF1499 family)
MGTVSNEKGCVIELLSLSGVGLSMLATTNMIAGEHSEQKLLPACKESHNCVSSYGGEKRQFIEPLRHGSSPDEAVACLKRITFGVDRAKVVALHPGSLKVEFRTRLGFVDDAVFVLDCRDRLIHMPGARLGYWDLGVNRRQLEKIRVRFEAWCP